MAFHAVTFVSLLLVCVVTAVLDVGFNVNRPKDVDTTERITFDVVVKNNGDGYNTTTGEFTCSVAGIYAFSLTITLSAEAGGAWCSIYKKADTWKSMQILGIVEVGPVAPATGIFPGSVTVYTHLVLGETVYLDQCSPASTMLQTPHSSFSGQLINAD